MNWRRAKTTLIFSFLVLNFILSYQLWKDWQERFTTAMSWTSLPKETLKVMKEKNISIDQNANVPTETPLMEELTYSFHSTPEEEKKARKLIQNPPDTKVVFSEDFAKILGDKIPQINRYSLDLPASREGSYFVFNRMEGKWPLFDVHLLLYYKDQKIGSFSQDLVEVKRSIGGKEHRVLSAEKALAKAIEVNLPSGAMIKEIRLGYHGEIFKEVNYQLATPSWRFLLANRGEIFYVNAITGKVTIEKEDS